MAQGHGFDSYVAWGPQVAFGTKLAAPANVQVNLRAGSVFTPRPYMQPRPSTGVGMPRSSQLYRGLKMVDWALALEWVSGAAGTGSIGFLGTLLNSAMGKYVKAPGPPVTRTVSINNPPIDGGTDTATDFYGRALTIQQVIKGIRAYDAQDCVPTSLQMVMEAGQPLRTEVSGVGHTLTDVAIGSAVAFADLSGTLITEFHARASGTASGLWLGAVNPLTATEAFNCRRCTITVNPNLKIDPYLGMSATQEYKNPPRAGYPEVTADLEMDYEGGLTGWDAQDAVTAFTAATRENFAVIYSLDANNKVEFRATAAPASAPGLVEAPVLVPSGDGAYGFSMRLRFYPDAMGTDIFFKTTSPD